MPVYHFVMHSYGTWQPDHKAGWYQHGVRRKLAPSKGIARHRREVQRWPTVHFSVDEQSQILILVRDIGEKRNWRCHAVAINPTHMHMIVSWRSAHTAAVVRHTYKRLLGLRMARLRKQPGRQWFSEGGRPSRIKDHDHLSRLLDFYLPKQGGTLWREKDGFQSRGWKPSAG